MSSGCSLMTMHFDGGPNKLNATCEKVGCLYKEQPSEDWQDSFIFHYVQSYVDQT